MVHSALIYFIVKHYYGENIRPLFVDGVMVPNSTGIGGLDMLGAVFSSIL